MDAGATTVVMPGARRRSSVRGMLILGVAILGVLGLLYSMSPTETVAQARARCESQAALSYDKDHPIGLKPLFPDDPAVRRARLDLSRLPNGYSTLPDGEGVLVTNGCAFVEQTGIATDSRVATLPTN